MRATFGSKMKIAATGVVAVFTVCVVGFVIAGSGKMTVDWPQWRGSNRDGVVANSPKLLDSIPKEGPPRIWKSEWIPGFYAGGCGGPVVVDGKVYVYVQWKQPVGGGNTYKLITPEVLANAGWLPDLPDDLAKSLEAAWASPKRPNSTGFAWWEIKDPQIAEKELEEFLAKKPELDKYIKDFLASLPLPAVMKFGSHIRRRLCINHEFNKWMNDPGYTWDELVKLSKMQGAGYPTLTEWAGELRKVTGRDHMGHHMSFSRFLDAVWKHGYTISSDTLVCLDGATGKTLWKKDFPLDADALAKLKQVDWCNGPFIDAGETLGVSSWPAVSGGKCFFTGAAGLYCLSAKDGALIWKVKREPLHPSVVVINNVVYHGGSAYNAENGQLLWKNPLWKGIPKWQQNGDNGSPGLWMFGGKTFLIASNGVGVPSCIDPLTGKALWTLPESKPGGSQPGAYGISGDTMVVLDGKYKLSPAGAEFAGKFLGGTFDHGSGQMIHQGFVYQFVAGYGDNRSNVQGLCCFDLKSGELKWQIKNEASPVLLADGKILTVECLDAGVWGAHKLDWVAATPEKYVSLGSFEMKMCPWSQPVALAGGGLFVRQEDGVACYNLRAK